MVIMERSHADMPYRQKMVYIDSLRQYGPFEVEDVSKRANHCEN